MVGSGSPWIQLPVFTIRQAAWCIQFGQQSPEMSQNEQEGVAIINIFSSNIKWYIL
jgi:hypothetical protein